VATLAVLLVVALAMRLPSLGEPANNFDEGVYLESLFLMALGYRPFTEIAASQGPLHLHAQLPFFLAFGQTVAAGRAASVVYSLVGLAGVWWIGRQLAGRWAGLAATLLVVLSPTYLRFSRQALADLPALAPVTLAIGVALLHRRVGRRRWVVLSGVLLALGLLMKPLVVGAVLTVALLIWRPGRAGWHDLLLLGGIVALTPFLVLLALGPWPVLEQVLGFREGARAAYGWDLRQNWDLIADKLDQEQLGFFLLASLGGGLLAPGRRRWAARAVIVWAVTSLGVLLAHSPLRYHQMVILVPPLAILGGAAVASIPRFVRGPRPMARILAALCGAALLVYAGGLPELVRRDLLLLENVDAAGSGSDTTDDADTAVERIRRLSGPDDFVLTDHPYLAFLAGRRVPPELVDPSETRLRAGDLTDERVLALAVAYRPKVVVLWNGKLNRLPRFMDWVTTTYRQDRRFGTVDDGQVRAVLRDRGA